MIYIGLIIVIGLFFFLDKFTKTQNSMFIVIILSFIGFVMLQNSPTLDFVDYTQVHKLNATHYQYSQVDVSTNAMGIFSVESFLVLVMWFFMVLASINLIVGKNEK